MMAETAGLSFTQGYWQEYCVDAWQRSILALDALRRRGNIFLEQNAQKAPNVLSFAFELVCDGRTLPRPVNFRLVRVVPPDGAVLDPAKPPFMVVNRRAGHGPGIGGMKHDSEIGVALAAGHACYFVGFLPVPVPGQTIEDVCAAEAAFVERVAGLHPQADGKPVVVGHCQAGWQLMMMAAIRPELSGPILLAVRRLQPVNRRPSLAALKAMFREQYLLLRLDETRTIWAIPHLLPDAPEQRSESWQTVQTVLRASDDMTADGEQWLQRLEALFTGPAGPPKVA